VSNRSEDHGFGISDEQLQQRLDQKPYSLIINNLIKVRDQQTPINKMRVVAQCSSLIIQAIDEFWNGVHEVKKKDLTLDADQLLMIFIYSTLQSRIPEFYAHLKLMNQFAT